ncbi:hypothetical protein FQ185_26280 [Pseudomonas sp. ANT_H12B]|nr:hypothetical protein FQ185_26280 [Pseudomonas sp. ANT_H12B]
MSTAWDFGILSIRKDEPLWELARDEAITADINVECPAAIASKLAPTGTAVGQLPCVYRPGARGLRKKIRRMTFIARYLPLSALPSAPGSTILQGQRQHLRNRHENRRPTAEVKD